MNDRPLQAHERHMSAVVASYEEDLQYLFSAADGELPGTDEGNDKLSMLGVDADDPGQSATDALNSYALSATITRTLTVSLALGGPTVLLSATVDGNEYGLERISSVTLFDSWAVPNETVLDDESALVRLFDEYVETYSE